MYNAFCIKCKKMVRVETDKNPKCPVCKSKVDVKGKVLKVTTSNGDFKPHV
jgi:DNA-directed RNA polymerase subunit RPC12/RpoP